MNVPSGNIMDLGDVRLKLHSTYSTFKIAQFLFHIKKEKKNKTPKIFVLLGTPEAYLTPNFCMGGICQKEVLPEAKST